MLIRKKGQRLRNERGGYTDVRYYGRKEMGRRAQDTVRHVDNMKVRRSDRRCRIMRGILTVNRLLRGRRALDRMLCRMHMGRHDSAQPEGQEKDACTKCTKTGEHSQDTRLHFDSR